ncbi:MAG TPA: hypothetical protein VFR86_10035, partial [Burkholderiaceae bacterium]|nr:hypothetical protein [Burkholderiaceae bacterium]
MNSPARATWVRRLLIIGGVLIAIAATIAWFARPAPVDVVVAEVARGKVESSIANTRAGAVEACQRAKLSTITGGRIDMLAVKEGDR